ncbi:protein-disulfide isomerase [Geothermobacter ehrlichii]|uniref:Protein-disulfide isomerase n=1 Tax=Geothermobacter ehrlichii TaxID=213224 RepID=A0A5D3WJL8_9BACT|nr:thioredoxin domain-containing protein [Geothermobacter ehrlichii]TYO98497.1 protein-disulfide isomerase [Geothermobacter ehrlichii]
MRIVSLPFLVLLLCLLPLHVFGEIESRVVRRVQVPEPVRQMAISPSGRTFFVLGEKTLYMFALDGRLQGSTEVGPDVNGLIVQGDNLVLLSREGKTTVEYLGFDVIQSVDVGDAPVRGNIDAPVTIVVFDDFQCPYCARLAPVLKQILERNPQKVRLALKNFPLPMHRFARKAALAALAAGKQGKFWEMHDLLFENYNRLSDQKIRELAGKVGLDLARFDRDMQDSALQGQVQQDLRQGQQLGVRGTPTVYINGRLVRDRSLNGLQQMIDLELRRLKKQAGS